MNRKFPNELEIPDCPLTNEMLSTELNAFFLSTNNNRITHPETSDNAASIKIPFICFLESFVFCLGFMNRNGTNRGGKIYVERKGKIFSIVHL